MPGGFSEVKVLDNFYQTSSFYPMPVVLVSTVSANGLTNVGSYSLCFPFGIAGEHYMMLISRGDSNTSTNLLGGNKKCTLNFIPYRRRFLKNAVCLGYPGETTEEKLRDCRFTLVPSMCREKEEGVSYPDVVSESIQIFECTWVDDKELFHYANDGGERHFLLRIDSILIKERWAAALRRGGRFPSLPVDYGYRDGKYFWFAHHGRPYSEPIPKNKGIDANSVAYEVQRMPYDLEWEDAAYERLVKVPRVFLKKVLTAISERAISDGEKRITPGLLDKYNKKER